MMKLFSTQCILIVLCLLSTSGFGQVRFEQIVSERNRPFFSNEITYTSFTNDTIHFMYSFRISNDFITFINNSVGVVPNYTADLILNLELHFADSTIERLSERFVKSISDYNTTQHRFSYVQGSIISRSKMPITYIYVDILDKGNNKPIFKNPVKYLVPKFNFADILSVSIFYNNISDYLTLKNFGNQIQYNSSQLFGMITTSLKDSTFQPYLKLEFKRNFGDDFVVYQDSIKLSASKEKILITSSGDKNRVPVFFSELHINVEDMELGQYRLIIRNQKQLDTLTFQNRWLNMPYSLYDLEIATRVLRYITDDETYDNLTSGNSKNREAVFRKFWKEKDPTPETAYNELMFEFYRRVDYAYVQFYTNKNYGWRTDRGRTYILYGEPQQIQRTTPPNQPPQEIWIYSQINKRFVFADIDRKGDFQLIEPKQ